MSASTRLVRLIGGLLAAAALALIVGPVLALIAAVPWSRVTGQLASAEAWSALRLSLTTSLTAAVLCGVLGVPLAWWLAGGESRSRTAARRAIALPLVLPPVVAGVALLETFGPRRPAGRLLADAVGWQFTFQPSGVVLAQVFVALPFVVLVMDAAFGRLDPAPIEAAHTLGAGWWRTGVTAVLPQVGGSLLAALTLAWARSVGEFGATLTFAGNVADRTRTLPIAVYEQLGSDPSAALATSVLLLVVAAAVIVALRSHAPRLTALR